MSNLFLLVLLNQGGGAVLVRVRVWSSHKTVEIKGNTYTDREQ